MTRRFGRAFLTTAAILIMLINLVAVLLYGRQFYACIGSVDQKAGELPALCGEVSQQNFAAPFIIINLFIIALVVTIWLLVRYYIRRHHSQNG